MSKKLIEQKEEAALKYYKYITEGKHFLASYWQKKLKKFVDMESKAAALIKRQLAEEGVKRLNTVKI